MISSDIIRGYNDTFILSLLWDGPSYGYAIGRAIRDRTGDQYIIKDTTLYSAFNRLVKNGYITAFPGEKTHGRPRTYYRITDAGKQYYLEKCEEWQTTRRVVEAFIHED